jgi:hypothetical protein
MNKKTILPPAVLGVSLLLALLGATYAQPNAAANSRVRASQKRSAEASGTYTLAAAALRSIADRIKACPRIIEFDASKDSQASEGPLERSRLYYGPPVNVTWGVGRNSMRSPHQGFVQFSVPREFWVPLDVRNRWANEAAGLYAEMLQAMPSLEYRYKFAVGPDGLQLIGMLVRTAGQSEWKEAQHEKACSSSGCAPSCWQSAAQPNPSLLDARKR